MPGINSNINELSRVGDKTAGQFKKLGLNKVRDLLFHFPFRYDDFSRLSPINDLKIGENANIIGQIELIQNKRSPKKRMYITEALITDESGSIRAIWFNQPYITRVLSVGDSVSLAGKVEEDYGGAVMISPVYEKAGPVIHRSAVEEKNNSVRPTFSGTHTQGLVPVYHSGGSLTQKLIRYSIKQSLHAASKLPDWLPQEISRELGLLKIPEAIKLIHFPKNRIDIDLAKKRLAFDELFLIQLQSQLIRTEMDVSLAHRLRFFEKETREFVDSLPFRLTDAQKKTTWEILKDLEKERPMSRMLSGDVGSGKTVVAVIAMLNAVLNGKQAVLMVPTEILARQHFETVKKYFKHLDIKIGIATRTEKKLKADIIIGTHALIQEKIEFKNLALAIIDEQHRFGVEQRKLLIEKSTSKGIEKLFVPHFLSMTATPIPRSLALALYGELDVSIINEMPEGRKKIRTNVIPEEKREATYEFIRKEVRMGRQVFVICPLIDTSDQLGVKSVKEEFEKLNEYIFPELQIGLMHGRLKSKEKEKVMENFLANKIKILVSTSVIEVGIDIPNATIMMIEGADRFGLAQLHQFRGRVGRGEYESYCFLFTESSAEKTMRRLKAMAEIDDGFRLAKMDLELRGPGEVYGTAQKGFPELKIATLFDYESMRQAKEAAEKIIIEDADLNKWPLLKEKLGEWEKTIHME